MKIHQNTYSQLQVHKAVHLSYLPGIYVECERSVLFWLMMSINSMGHHFTLSAENRFLSSDVRATLRRRPCAASNRRRRGNTVTFSSLWKSCHKTLATIITVITGRRAYFSVERRPPTYFKPFFSYNPLTKKDDLLSSISFHSNQS